MNVECRPVFEWSCLMFFVPNWYLFVEMVFKGLGQGSMACSCCRAIEKFDHVLLWRIVGQFGDICPKQ